MYIVSNAIFGQPHLTQPLPSTWTWTPIALILESRPVQFRVDSFMFVVLVPLQHCHYLEDWPGMEELKTLRSHVHPYRQCYLLWLTTS
jgi:hypothetical protein